MKVLYAFIMIGLSKDIRGYTTLLKKIFAALALAAMLGSVAPVFSQASTSTYTRTKAISVAERNLGVPYVWGGMSPRGFDCSGLVKYSYSAAGKYLPRTAGDMFYVGYRTHSLTRGDLVFFATSRAEKPTHVGIYIGNNDFINAASSKGVSIASLSNPYWGPRYVGAKHI
jgi:murein DD-endopeptidase